MHKETIIVNFKAYGQSTGENAVRLAKICEKVAIEMKADIRVAVSAPDLYPVSRAVKIPVYAEHVDAYPLGPYTGSVLPEVVKVAGAAGTLINHSERRLPEPKVEETLQRVKALGMAAIVCAEDDEEGLLLAKFNPDFIAVEPKELIGGNISVSTAKPELISDSVRKIREGKGIKVLVGAGIKNRQDVETAMKLGADGILIASGVVLAADPEKALKGLFIQE